MQFVGNQNQKTTGFRLGLLMNFGKALGVGPAALGQLPKTAPEKTALAWWLRRRTTVSLRWVSERLELGHYSRVS